jgi:hypothetical protein
MRPNLIFTGPTLSHPEAQNAVDAICLPPAAQGSIVAAVQHYDPAVIVLIDGYFQSEPAVRHKEILWTISQGIPVIGAASMGALRAAELYPHMQGVGVIYRWYRRFPFAQDDAIAVLHGPQEVNFSPLTHSFVDVRRTIRAACRSNLIPADLAGKLENTARNLNFRERTLAQIIQNALPTSDDVDINRHRQTLAASFIGQKKRDALSAIQLLRNEIRPPEKLINFKMTLAFYQELEDAGLAI